MRLRWKIVLAAGLVLAGGVAVLTWYEESENQERRSRAEDAVLARLRSGPFDETTDVDELLKVFDYQGASNASHIYADKFLRVTGRYYDATRDKDGAMLVVVSGNETSRGVMCAYIGNDDLIRRFHRREKIVMHAIGAVDVKGAIGLGSCVIEPP